MISHDQASRRQKTKPRIPIGTRIYAVGDIHGRSDLLDALFARIDLHLAQNPIPQPVQVLLGDYIDRGPNSRRVIDALIARRRLHRTVYLKGNHESYALQFLNEPSVWPEWQQAGGMHTLLSYGLNPQGQADTQHCQELSAAFRRILPQAHHRFLQSLALSYACGDFFFVHAGIRPGLPLARQSAYDLLWIREDFILYEEEFEKFIVHGHTPSMEPDLRRNRINIDTGAYATGRLTCLVLEGDQMTFL